MMMIPAEHGLAGHFWLLQKNRESATSKVGWLATNPGSRRGLPDPLRDGLASELLLRAQRQQFLQDFLCQQLHNSSPRFFL